MLTTAYSQKIFILYSLEFQLDGWRVLVTLQVTILSSSCICGTNVHVLLVSQVCDVGCLSYFQNHLYEPFGKTSSKMQFKVTFLPNWDLLKDGDPRMETLYGPSEQINYTLCENRRNDYIKHYNLVYLLCIFILCILCILCIPPHRHNHSQTPTRPMFVVVYVCCVSTWTV